jgi:hypothetical protein
MPVGSVLPFLYTRYSEACANVRATRLKHQDALDAVEQAEAEKERLEAQIREQISWVAVARGERVFYASDHAQVIVQGCESRDVDAARLCELCEAHNVDHSDLVKTVVVMKKLDALVEAGALDPAAVDAITTRSAATTRVLFRAPQPNQEE